jgi:hypothetical protein
MTKATLGFVGVCIVVFCAGIAMLDAGQAFAGNCPSTGCGHLPGPAPLIGAVGGPAGLLATGLVYAGYLATRRYRKNAKREADAVSDR